MTTKRLKTLSENCMEWKKISSGQFKIHLDTEDSIDYVSVFVKKNMEKDVGHTLDITQAINETLLEIDTENLLILIDITKDNKIKHIEVIGM